MNEKNVVEDFKNAEAQLREERLKLATRIAEIDAMLVRRGENSLGGKICAFLREHPHSTYAEIVLGTNASAGSVAARLQDLRLKDKLTRTGTCGKYRYALKEGST